MLTYRGLFLLPRLFCTKIRGYSDPPYRGGAFSNDSFPPRFFSDFCQKTSDFEKYFWYPIIFFRFLSKNPRYRKIFWGTPIFFSEFSPKKFKKSDFCQKNPYLKKTGTPRNFWAVGGGHLATTFFPPDFVQILAKNFRWFRKIFLVPPDFFQNFVKKYKISKNILGVRGGHLLSANKFQKINSAKMKKYWKKLKIPIDSFSWVL